MLTNNIKAGARIRLRNGWMATVRDNKKGNIRMCEVEGVYTELGSTYVWDWAAVQTSEGWRNVTLTLKQQKDRAFVSELVG